jgi:hypothetical protein
MRINVYQLRKSTTEIQFLLLASTCTLYIFITQTKGIIYYFIFIKIQYSYKCNITVNLLVKLIFKGVIFQIFIVNNLIRYLYSSQKMRFYGFEEKG